MNLSAGIVQGFSHHIAHVLFKAPPNGRFWTQQHGGKKNTVNEIDSSVVHFYRESYIVYSEYFHL